MKITGLDALQKNLSDAQRALEALDGELGSVSFTPSDPSSIDAAITQVQDFLVEDRLIS